MGRYNRKNMCSTCMMCSHTYQGCFCNLTDEQVKYNQEGCIDYLPVEIDPNFDIKEDDDDNQ